MTASQKNDAPGKTGVLHIKPTINSKVVGNAYFKGKKVKGASGAEYVLPGRSFTLNGDGVVLNLAHEENWKTADIILGPNPGIRAWFNPAAKLLYRFDILDIRKEAEEYLKNDELKTDYKSQVVKLKDMELKTIGFMFRLGNEPKTIKAGLYKLIDGTAEQRSKVGKFLMNSDRLLLMYVYFALKQGDAANKSGLYNNGKDLFYFNDSPIGLGEENLIAFLKKETEESQVIYALLRDEYEANLVRESK